MRRVGFCVAIGGLALAMPLLAQKNAGLPASAAPPVQPGETIVLGDAANRMTVPVEIAGKGPYQFIIDTGAERSVVSRELAQSLGLDAGSRARLFDFTGPSMVDTVRVPSLTAGTLATAAMEAPALDAANLGAPGMLGIDALQGRKVVIDFDRKRMTVMPATRRTGGEIVVGAQTRTGQLIVTDATFHGQKIAVIIDTGTWISVGNKPMLALARKRPRALGPITITSVTGRSFDANFVAVNELRIGGVRFDNFGLSFADVKPFERFGLADQPALILGMSSLKLFRRVEIDFLHRRVGFTLPRPHINFRSVCHSGTALCNNVPAGQ